MKYFAFLHYFYSYPVSRVFRLCFFLGLTIFAMLHLQDLASVKLVLFALSLFLMNEVFVQFYIARRMPLQTVSDQQESLRNALTLAATECLEGGDFNSIVSRLLTYPSVKFLLNKATIPLKEVKAISLDTEAFLQQAQKQAIASKGKYITTVDMMVAYLLLSEEKTKLLFQKNLKPEDIEWIGYWARIQYSQEEVQKKNRVTLWGEGIGQSWVSGWTLETKKYTQNFTNVIVNKEKLLRGREKEYAELLEVLAKKQNNNVILIGETGAGKETLIEGLAVDSFLGKLQPELSHKRIFELLVGALLAGVMTRGDLQQRLESILQEVSHSGDIILYIPEFQNVLGTSSFGIDISDILVPYLRNGKMPIIGTMTAANYKSYMEKNLLREEFDVITLSEPDKKQAIEMLFEKIPEIEGKYGVSISYTAVLSAVDLAGKYAVDTVLPGNAVLLLEDTANAISQRSEKVVLPQHILDKVESKTHIKVGAPGEQEKNLLLHMEETLHKRVVGQDGAIHAVAESFRRLRSGIATPDRPISFLFLGPTGVGKTETAKAVASVYFGSDEKMIRLDMSEYSDATAVMKLLGTPDGQQRGELTEAVHDNPFSLILLDEFEKANPNVLDLFLQVLEDGRLTDTTGKTVSFVNSIIIATSNAASELIREAISQGITIDASFQGKLLDYLQQKAIFKPELLNRFDAIVAFRSLSTQEVVQVVGLLLQETIEKLKKQDITVVFDPTVVDAVAKQGYDVTFGARPLRRFIQDKIEDTLAKKLLEGSVIRGQTVTVFVGPTGEISLK